MATVELPVLPLRQGTVPVDVEIIYRYLQVLIQLLTDNISSNTYLTAIPTATDLAEGQWALSYIAPTLSVHLNVAGVILTTQLGEPA